MEGLTHFISMPIDGITALSPSKVAPCQSYRMQQCFSGPGKRVVTTVDEKTTWELENVLSDVLPP